MVNLSIPLPPCPLRGGGGTPRPTPVDPGPLTQSPKKLHSTRPFSKPRGGNETHCSPCDDKGHAYAWREYVGWESVKGAIFAGDVWGRFSSANIVVVAA